MEEIHYFTETRKRTWNGSTRHAWIVHAMHEASKLHMALEFHFDTMPRNPDIDPQLFGDEEYCGELAYCFGVEIHSNQRIYSYGSYIKQCSIIAGNCYCDGNSLWGQSLFNRFCAYGEPNSEVIFAELKEPLTNRMKERIGKPRVRKQS